ncbi:pyridoxamine 5'-phosphate oxidase family protein [Ramlibacter sp. 2FC]|uniref:HugZ family pyridoxamine 5'-phosphate oxidase n=1 Tax=Ramlibacter sp. 2FC TaxID=2502188 RepID=UPI0010F80EBA|nr:pyridoxamine 5'-phosphate oxidase family protein [Ramlibacter sp. 2FC]
MPAQAPEPSAESRLDQALRALLASRRTAALSTLQAAAPDRPSVSMVPYALLPGAGSLVLHVSSLAGHTRNLLAQPRVSLLVAAPEAEGEPVHALPRVTLEGLARLPEPGSADWEAARTAYLARFPEAEPMTQLGDFSFVLVALSGARQVAGFGAARSLDAERLAGLLEA